MVGGSTNAFGDTAGGSHSAAKVRMQSVSPIIDNKREAVLRAEDNMEMQAEVRRGHRDSGTLSGCKPFKLRFPWAALRLPTANFQHPFGMKSRANFRHPFGTKAELMIRADADDSKAVSLMLQLPHSNRGECYQGGY